MTKDELTRELRKLNPKELAEVVGDATVGMDPFGEFEPHRFVLAVADKTHRLRIVCRPDELWADDSPLCQSGEHAGLGTISWSKESCCPVCGGQVSGT